MRMIHLAVALVALASVGCASITDGTTQTIIFKLDPQETRCVATRDGDGELGTVTSTLSTLTVGKDKDDIILLCKAPGYQDKTMRLVSKTQTAGVVGGVFLDLGITDMITGAMWKYPLDVSIGLDKIGAPPTATPGTTN